jgi:hypothetical protein
MNASDASPRLHNMSAPPRSLINFRPIQPSGRSKATGTGQAGMGTSGLRWLCRIDVINRFWPEPPGMGRDPAEGVDWTLTREPERRLLAQALAEERGVAEADEALSSEIAALPAEDVFDRLREVAQRVDLVVLSLPRMALLLPASPASRRPEASDMRLAVAVLTRRRGTVFLRDADPIPLAQVYRPLDLWEPCATGAQGRRDEAR